LEKRGRGGGSAGGRVFPQLRLRGVRGAPRANPRLGKRGRGEGVSQRKIYKRRE